MSVYLSGVVCLFGNLPPLEKSANHQINKTKKPPLGIYTMCVPTMRKHDMRNSAMDSGVKACASKPVRGSIPQTPQHPAASARKTRNKTQQAINLALGIQRHLDNAPVRPLVHHGRQRIVLPARLIASAVLEPRGLLLPERLVVGALGPRVLSAEPAARRAAER